MEPIQIQLKLFGALRQFASQPELRFDVPRGTRVADLRNHLVEALRRENAAFDNVSLIADCVLADDARVLKEDHALDPPSGSARLAILPPVCGG